MIRFNYPLFFALDFHHVLLHPRRSTLEHESRAKVNLNHHGHIPLIVANMDYIATFEMAKIYKEYNILTAILKDYTAQQWDEAVQKHGLESRLLVPTIGIRDFDKELDKIEAIVRSHKDIPFVSMDVPNAYLKVVLERTQQFKERFPDVKLSVGNVVTIEGVEGLHKAGASMAKVGIGSGSACLTRRMTGVGYPQFSAIHDMAQAAHELGIELISDGGMTESGSAVKAYAAGASYVMAGGFFAGHDETGSKFHGMSSHQSREHRGEEKASYRASEGRAVTLKSRGSIHNTLSELMGGFRSACTMLNVSSLQDLPQASLTAEVVMQQLNRVAGVENEE